MVNGTRTIYLISKYLIQSQTGTTILGALVAVVRSNRYIYVSQFPIWINHGSMFVLLQSTNYNYEHKTIQFPDCCFWIMFCTLLKFFKPFNLFILWNWANLCFFVKDLKTNILFATQRHWHAKHRMAFGTSPPHLHPNPTHHN